MCVCVCVCVCVCHRVRGIPREKVISDVMLADQPTKKVSVGLWKPHIALRTAHVFPDSTGEVHRRGILEPCQSSYTN